VLALTLLIPNLKYRAPLHGGAFSRLLAQATYEAAIGIRLSQETREG
jgi:hypothetical protein